MLKNKKLKVEIIQLYYNVLVVGYKERQKITELVMRNYWWLEITKDVRKYINRYDMCQRIKNCIEILVKKLVVNKILKKL